MSNRFYLPAILILGLLLRVVSLNQSLWLDEAISINAAKNYSFGQIIAEFSQKDFHPPLHYFLLKIWMTIFGTDEVAARSLSLLFGLGTIYLVFLIGQKIFNKKVGIASALLLATAPLHVYYSQEVRMYAQATFFASLVMLFFADVFRKPSFSAWFWLFLSVALLIYTDYPPVFLLLSLFIYLVVFEGRHLLQYAKYWSLFLLGIVASFFPWLPTFFNQLAAGMDVKKDAPLWWASLGKTNLKELALVPIKFTIGRISFFNKLVYAIVVFIPLAFFSALFFKAWSDLSKTKLVWFWLVPPILFAAFFGFVGSGFSYFRLLFVLPAFYILLAYGVFSFSKSRYVVLAIVIINLTFTGIYLFNPRYHREDWRGAVAWIEEHSGENAATIFVTNKPLDPYLYYAKRIPGVGQESFGKDSFDTIWLMRYVQPIFDPDDKVRNKVEEQGYKKMGERDFNGVVVWEYQKIK